MSTSESPTEIEPRPGVIFTYYETKITVERVNMRGTMPGRWFVTGDDGGVYQIEYNPGLQTWLTVYA